ncbi:MAG: NAD-dependent epimerase/dehydratase family protein, partial [Zoogloeaceae bacterium]|nr:NAD-dependent epimerase/dehydratase family protein [Zoogloeaceae bacterium]
MKFLLTGASGFIGGHLCRHLLKTGHTVRAVCSAPERADSLRALAKNATALEFVSLEHAACHNPALWREACQGVEAVFHLAARAHRGDKSSPDALAAYRRANLETTRALATAACDAGVGHFI